jgi:hypothetical protein
MVSISVAGVKRNHRHLEKKYNAQSEFRVSCIKCLLLVYTRIYITINIAQFLYLSRIVNFINLFIHSDNYMLHQFWH